MHPKTLNKFRSNFVKSGKGLHEVAILRGCISERKREREREREEKQKTIGYT